MDPREQLREEVVETREDFHRLLARVSDDALARPSGNPAWTVGQVLYHMSLAHRLLIADVRLFTGQGWPVRVLAALVPKALFDALMARLTRWGARRVSREFLAREYDRAHERALRALEAVAPEDFARALPYPDWDPLLSGRVTLERLFHYVRLHFVAHAAEVERGIGG